MINTVRTKRRLFFPFLLSIGRRKPILESSPRPFLYGKWHFSSKYDCPKVARALPMNLTIDFIEKYSIHKKDLTFVSFPLQGSKNPIFYSKSGFFPLYS